VGDLGQAIGLLGIKPLKLLALGFSLPESLFLEAARDQLDWYWKSALVRAVAAREISEQLLKKPGDDCFLAGLLQDLGVLVLLGDVGRPYARLLNEVIVIGADLRRLEQESLGFDHVQLTAGLLEHWKLPRPLVAAVAEPRDVRKWAKSKADHAHVVRVLHLAELVTQLVAQRRLSVLPDLLEAGAAYCSLDKPGLNDFIGTLEPKVKQLGSVLSLNVKDFGGYVHMLTQAHERMSRLAESVAGTLSHALAADAATPIESEPDEMQALLLARQLRASFEEFFSEPGSARQADGEYLASESTEAGVGEPYQPLLAESRGRRRRPLGEQDDLAIRLTLAVGRCRSLRQPLNLALVAIEPANDYTTADQMRMERLLEATCQEFVDGHCESIERPGELRRVLLLTNRERMAAVGVARQVVERLRRSAAKMQHAGLMEACVMAAGVASVATPAKNFRPLSLLETAERCLAAALASGGVKSLEVS
jgi:hypothetical protein